MVRTLVDLQKALQAFPNVPPCTPIKVMAAEECVAYGEEYWWECHVSKVTLEEVAINTTEYDDVGKEIYRKDVSWVEQEIADDLFTFDNRFKTFDEAYIEAKRQMDQLVWSPVIIIWIEPGGNV